MSTKTLRKRIALATVAALGAGVLSLVSGSAANAATGTANSAAGTAGPAATANALNIGTTSTTSGSAVVSTSYASNASLGLLSVGNLTSSTANSDNTQSATLLSSGVLVVYTTIAATTAGAISVTNGTITTSPAAAVDSNIQTAYGAGNTVIGFDRDNNGVAGTAGSKVIAVGVKPNSGATTMTVSYYTGTFNASTGTYLTYSTAPTTGTLSGNITVTLAASSSAGTVSLTNSGIYYATNSYNSGTKTSDDTTPSAGQQTIGTSTYNSPQYATALVRDAYSSAISAGALIQATATNGYVSIVSGANSTTPTASTSFVTSVAGSKYYGLQVLPLTNDGGVVTVNVTVNGTAIGVKSFTFLGKVAKVLLSAPNNGKATVAAGTTKTTPGNTATLKFQDKAGNTLYIGANAYSTTSYPNAVTRNSTATTGVTSTITNALPGAAALAAGGFSTSAGYVAWGCNPTNSSGQLAVDYTNLDGTVVTSNSVPVTCTGAPYSFSAAFDKSTYAPGDIATLTVTFKDSTGALAADVYTLDDLGAVASSAISGSGAANLATITASQMTAVGGTSSTNVGSATDVTTNGVIKYKLVVGTTTGSYQAIVAFPSVTTDTATLAYKIADGATSLNDVLKGIVSLIASINKQIAALAKLVTAKKK